ASCNASFSNCLKLLISSMSLIRLLGPKQRVLASQELSHSEDEGGEDEDIAMNRCDGLDMDDFRIGRGRGRGRLEKHWR
ncbi:hypothetical protein H5410_056791, partial [Solanum commersonii]